MYTGALARDGDIFIFYILFTLVAKRLTEVYFNIVWEKQITPCDWTCLHRGVSSKLKRIASEIVAIKRDCQLYYIWNSMIFGHLNHKIELFKNAPKLNQYTSNSELCEKRLVILPNSNKNV